MHSYKKTILLGKLFRVFSILLIAGAIISLFATITSDDQDLRGTGIRLVLDLAVSSLVCYTICHMLELLANIANDIDTIMEEKNIP